jgi:hypothetical protein
MSLNYTFPISTAYVTSHTKSSDSFSGHIAVSLELRNSSEVHLLLSPPAYDYTSAAYYPAQSQGHVATAGPSISKFWDRAYDQIFITLTTQLRNSADLYRRGTDTGIQKTRHVIAIQPVHWRSVLTYRKHVTWSISTVVWRHHLRGSVFAEPLLRNGLRHPVVVLLRVCIAGCLSSRCLEMRWHITLFLCGCETSLALCEQICKGNASIWETGSTRIKTIHKWNIS